jgi:hypothetical protein
MSSLGTRAREIKLWEPTIRGLAKLPDSVRNTNSGRPRDTLWIPNTTPKIQNRRETQRQRLDRKLVVTTSCVVLIICLLLRDAVRRSDCVSWQEALDTGDF